MSIDKEIFLTLTNADNSIPLANGIIELSITPFAEEMNKSVDEFEGERIPNFPSLDPNDSDFEELQIKDIRPDLLSVALMGPLLDIELLINEEKLITMMHITIFDDLDSLKEVENVIKDIKWMHSENISTKLLNRFKNVKIEIGNQYLVITNVKVDIIFDKYNVPYMDDPETVDYDIKYLIKLNI